MNFIKKNEIFKILFPELISNRTYKFIYQMRWEKKKPMLNLYEQTVMHFGA